MAELLTANKRLKSSKAFGPDNIPAIIWKDKHFHQLLLNLCNHTFYTNICPSIWLKSQLLPKKGDLSLVTNYRGISLMPLLLSYIIKCFSTASFLILNRFLERTRKVSDEEDTLSVNSPSMSPKAN